MSIQFERLREVARFHSPLEEMRLVEHHIERRRDPLTGRWAVLSNALKGKGALFFGPPDHERIKKVAETSRETCFFCPERVEEMTPRYPEAWLKDGCLREGDCFLFPNLFPLGAVHAVIALGKTHYRRLNDFPSALLRDGLHAAVSFVRAVHREDPSLASFTVNANYLFPAGASLVHPHLQILGGARPCTAVERLMEAARRFRSEHDADYFQTLVTEEHERNERYVTATGPVHWLTPFAPIGTHEVLGVLPGYGNLRALDEPAVVGLADGLSRILAYYHRLDFSTFNFTVYSAPASMQDRPFPVFMRIVCRQNVYENYRADDYFMQKLLEEELAITSPEELATGLRNFWA